MLVPAHNESAVIEAKIDNFQSLNYPANLIELIIADDGSNDGTAERVRGSADKRVLLLVSRQRVGKAATMNRLVDAAHNPLLLFSDANVIMDPDAVRRLGDCLADSQVGAVTGEVRLVGSDREFSAGEALYYEMERRVQLAESRIGSVMGVDGGMYLVRRELYQLLPVDTVLDDFTVSMNVIRAGRRIVYSSAAQATESGTPSAQQEFSRRSRIAAGAVQLLKRGRIPLFNQPVLWFKFVSHKVLRWFSPLLLTGFLFTNLCLLGQGVVYYLVFCGQLMCYLSICVVCLFPVLRRSLPGGIIYFFGLSQSAMALGLLKGLFNRQPSQWVKVDRSDMGQTRA